MEKHIKVARAHRALSWLYGLMTVLFLFLIFGVEKSSFAMYFLLILPGGLFALHHYTAKGAREKKPWARKVSMGIAIVMLLGFPMGTLIGIYLLINNFKAEENIASGNSFGQNGEYGKGAGMHTEV